MINHVLFTLTIFLSIFSIVYNADALPYDDTHLQASVNWSSAVPVHGYGERRQAKESSQQNAAVLGDVDVSTPRQEGNLARTSFLVLL